MKDDKKTILQAKI